MRGHLALRVGGHPQVEEARAGDLGRAHAVVVGKHRREVGGEVARVQARLLGQLQRDVRGVVAVLLDLGSLHAHLGGHAVGEAEPSLVDEPLEGGHDHVAELLGSHRTSLSSGAPLPARGKP